MKSNKSYEVNIRPKAKKSLEKITKVDRVRIQAAIELLSRNPHPPASRQLSNSEYFRVRIGDYRILYDVYEDKLIILINDIAHRRMIYQDI